MNTKDGSSPSAAGLACLAARMVVARYLNGATLKGTTHDFAPNKAIFHVFEDGDETRKARTVEMDELKAVFYVKSYAGEKSHRDSYDFAKIRSSGRKVAVMFHDDEIVAGYTMGYDPSRQGFFLVPADPESNNSRIYILNSAVKKMRWM